jgi:hypothetical protein
MQLKTLESLMEFYVTDFIVENHQLLLVIDMHSFN